MTQRIRTLAVGVAVALGAAAAGALTLSPNTPANAQAPSAPVHVAQAPVTTPSGAQMQVLPDFADLVEKYGPAVVNINTTTRSSRTQVPGLSEDDPFYEFFRRFMPPESRPERTPRSTPPGPAQPTPRGPTRPLGLGSGFVISPDGYIVTNAHVVENADEITVRFTDKREMKAKVVGADKRSDVAVIKVEGTGLPTVKIGSNARTRVGEWVVAIGSPFGFSNTVTAGIISATSRENLSDPNMDAVPFIQTDVAVNPGNSGGPLMNLRGEVIGINSQIFSRTGSFAGISFAIPIDFAMNVANQLQAGGKVTRGRIGVQIASVNRDTADSLSLPKVQGAVVGAVEDDSPAGKAGIEVGDVILKVDGKTIDGSPELSRYVRQVKPGTKVTMSLWREGKTRDVVVTVGELKEEGATRTAAAKSNKPDVKTGKLGVAVTEVKDEQKKKLKVAGGVAVEAVDATALGAGIQPGDVILRVNNTPVTNVKSFNEAIAKLDTKKPVVLLVRDENGARVITFRPEEG